LRRDSDQTLIGDSRSSFPVLDFSRISPRCAGFTRWLLASAARFCEDHFSAEPIVTFRSFAAASAASLLLLTACGDRNPTGPSSHRAPGAARADVSGGNGTLFVFTWYDANASGTWDAGENAIEGWPISIPALGSGPFSTTVVQVVPEGDYTISEANPLQSNWYTTRNGGTPSTALLLTDGVVASQTVHVTAGVTSFPAFGNLCLGGAGAHGVGFWTGKDGKALMGGNGNNGVSFLNYFVPFPNGSDHYDYWRNADGTRVSYADGSGTHYGFADYNSFRSWALNATGTNMAYMLSVQLAAAKLNIATGSVWSGELVYAPGTDAPTVYVPSFNDYWDLADQAQALLYANGADILNLAPGSALRASAEAIKNALARANTNVGFVQHTPCALTF
jgi:hypothetical protein